MDSPIEIEGDGAGRQEDVDEPEPRIRVRQPKRVAAADMVAPDDVEPREDLDNDPIGAPEEEEEWVDDEFEEEEDVDRR